VSDIALSFAPSGGAERLARVTGGDDVDLPGEASPVVGGQVAELFGVREPCGEDGEGIAVDLSAPASLAADNSFNGKVEPAVAAAQRQDVHGRPTISARQRGHRPSGPTSRAVMGTAALATWRRSTCPPALSTH